ncbi:MAG: hypothetical protein H6558_09115 [Lewinellaceae bacterium]|nr:hypothetical protein [Lewinellaceae bacterium]
MKKIIQLSFLLFALLFIIQVDAYGQRGGKKKQDVDKYFDESGGFAHRLWYGGGFSLGFSGNNFESIFQIGLSPMVGYKITEEFSVGPRANLSYFLYRGETFTPAGVQGANLFEYGLGAFARYKVFRSIFVHLEYGFDNEARIFGYDEIARDWITDRRVRNNAFVGGGYNDGNGVWGYEIYLLYNVLQEDNTLALPLDFRFGITYNF